MSFVLLGKDVFVLLKGIDCLSIDEGDGDVMFIVPIVFFIGGVVTCVVGLLVVMVELL